MRNESRPEGLIDERVGAKRRRYAGPNADYGGSGAPC
jgi:hypothetical protein